MCHIYLVVWTWSRIWFSRWYLLPVSWRWTRWCRLLPSPGWYGTQSSPGHTALQVQPGTTIVSTPPQIREAGHVSPLLPGLVGAGYDWSGVVLHCSPQPHLLIILQPGLGRGLVAKEREGEVTSPVPALRPRLRPCSNHQCLQEAGVLQRNWK